MQLLGHVREIFLAKDESALKTATIVATLNESEEWPWGAYGHGAGLRDRDLAKLLKPYAIRPHPHRFPDGLARGYRLEQFEESWDRYLPRDERNERNRVTDPGNTGPGEPSNDGESYGVTDVSEDPGASAPPLFDDPGEAP